MGTGGNHRGTPVSHRDQNGYPDSESSPVYFCGDCRRDGATPAEVRERGAQLYPGVAVGTRGASNTYDYLIIRGFAADGQSQNNYLNGLKMQGNFYNDAVIDPYMLERAEVMRGPVSFCTVRATCAVC